MPRYAVLFLLLLVFGPGLAIAGAPRVEMIGHRGASFDAPENTVAAIRLCWLQGSDASELDIYLSKDGKIVVLHDKDTKRVGGVDRPVVEQTFDELRKLDVGRWKGEKFAGEKIPTLLEMLETIPAGKRLFIEIKVGPEIVAELDRVLKQSGKKPAQTPIISFNAASVAAVKKLRPDLEAYLLVSMNTKKGKAPPTAEELIARARKVNADGLDLSAAPEIDKAFADKVHKAGLKLYVWTVNDPAVARRMAEAGVEGITTDRPGWLREQLTPQRIDVTPRK